MTDEEDAKYLTLSDAEKLRLLARDYEEATSFGIKRFIEGRMMELTIAMDEHPEWFKHGCGCKECCSNA